MSSGKVTSRYQVLIADDDESMRLLIASILSAELDADVHVAGTCEQALRLAENYPYDAILLDLMMPGIGGFGVLYWVRRSVPNAATPVIMVSVVSEHDAITRCLAAGANAYLVKPVKRAELAKAVQDQLVTRGKNRTSLK
jgi:OmpR-family two-component system manganese-sensing response regulator